MMCQYESIKLCIFFCLINGFQSALKWANIAGNVLCVCVFWWGFFFDNGVSVCVSMCVVVCMASINNGQYTFHL